MAQAITSSCTVSRPLPIHQAVDVAGFRQIFVVCPTTTDTGDTIAINLADHGITTFLSVYGVVHTTAGSVVVAEAPTTSVSAGVLTITTGGSAASDKRRVYTVLGYTATI